MNPLSWRNPGRAWSVGVTLFVITTAAALWWTRGTGLAPQSRLPPLEVTTDRLDFGEVVETDRFLHEVPLRNASSAPLRVRLEKQCDCAGVEPETLTLEPGETRRVTARLDLLHNRLRYAGRAKRPYQAHLTAYYGERAGDQIPLVLTGTVRAVLDTWPPNVHLKEEMVEGEDSAEEVVTVKPVIPLRWLVVKYGPPPSYIKCTVEPTSHGYTLRVGVKAGMRRGWFSQNIVLQMAGEKGEALPEQQLQVTGTVTGRFVCVPAETMFGIRALGSSAEETIHLRSRKGEVFRVVQTPANCASTRVEPAAGAETAFRVVQRIEKAGVRNETLSFVVRDERGKDHAIEYKMMYYGTDRQDQ